MQFFAFRDGSEKYSSSVYISSPAPKSDQRAAERQALEGKFCTSLILDITGFYILM